jgi:predicted  nucleic acid-binding Zn-ribbon protein
MKNGNIIMDTIYFLPDMPGVSIAVWIIASMAFLFLAREPVLKMIQACSDATAGGLRKLAEWMKETAHSMREKDRKVLLESGVAKIQGEILQEFSRIDMANTKALNGYPKLQLKLDDNINQIQGDYEECGQVTPQAPGWSEVIESISRAQDTNNDRIIEKMLSEIHKSAVDGEKKAISEFRDATSKRHKILSSMAPVWKRVEKLGKEINDKVDRVMENSKNIEKYMSRYEKISTAEPESIDMLSSKVTKLFIISLIVIFVGLVGAFINFNLIALPMSELVPAGVRVAGMQVSEVSALVIVALELVLGIFMFEAIGVTHTFPQISNMTRGKRKIILFGCLLGLLFLSTVEASLAVLRENLAEAKNALDISLAGESAAGVENVNSQITLIGQALLGFVLPWILAVIAIPLEMFIEASQHAFARAYTILITLLCHLATAIAYLIEGLFNILGHLFEIYIIIPTQISNLFNGKPDGKSVGAT